jgi:hypothetical protein
MRVEMVARVRAEMEYDVQSEVPWWRTLRL